MTNSEHITGSEFWDALAPHHSTIEDSYLNLSSLRRILPEIQQPVLVVGAGQGLLVAELRKRGFQCDGVDLSPEMIKYAKLRRGLPLIQANAKAMPFAPGTYTTIIYATGVVDFIDDEQEIRAILNEARRVVSPSGKIFVAFYRVSPALEHFMARLGLLKNNVLSQREALESYQLAPLQTLAWAAKKAKLNYCRATVLALRSFALSTMHEKILTLKMQKIFRNLDHAHSVIQAAPEYLPYRNEAEIRNLFQRLAIPIKKLRAFASCHVVQI